MNTERGSFLLTAQEIYDPRVSVIIPTFNRSIFIGEAIESVLKQSFGDFEVIVVDDGSSDATVDVVSAIIDDRLIFLTQENRGRSAARNRAIALARGKYIAFLDSDDVYLGDKLAWQVAYLDLHPDVDMVYTSALCIDDQGRLLDKQSYVASEEGYIYKEVAFFRPLTITLPTVMLRRKVLDSVGVFDESLDRFEDTDLWRRIAKKHRIGIIAEPTCRLRTHSENALIAQDPKTLVQSVEYYVAKIFREDADVGLNFLQGGASRLFEYYGNALLSVPGWRRHGATMLKRSAEFAPGRILTILLRGLKVVAGSIMRQYISHSKTV